MMRSRPRFTLLAGHLAALGCLLPLSLVVADIAQAATESAGAATERAQLSLGMVFTAFMVMLGPVKLIGPFSAMTSHMDEALARKVALKGVGIACIGGLVAATVGQNILTSWGISLSALHFAGGLVLLLVALNNVLAQYEAPPPPTEPTIAPRNLAMSPLAFPTILTPYGLAIFMLLLAMTSDVRRGAYICAFFLIVMALNLAAMWFARAIVRRGGSALAILGAVLGVLQVALAIQMILTELRFLKLLPSP